VIAFYENLAILLALQLVELIHWQIQSFHCVEEEGLSAIFLPVTIEMRFLSIFYLVSPSFFTAGIFGANFGLGFAFWVED
jgi:hypothetical protein